MINNIELEIIETFIKRDRQERIIYELGNVKKRDTILIRRFAGPDVFKQDCLRPLDDLSPSKIWEYLFQIGNNRKVFFIGEERSEELTLEEAVTRAQAGEFCIIYYGNGRGFYQGEQEFGNTHRFMLLSE